jgi:hypothetical protein
MVEDFASNSGIYQGAFESHNAPSGDCCKKDTLTVFFLPLLPASWSQNHQMISLSNLGKRDLVRISMTRSIPYRTKVSMARLMLKVLS